MNKRIITLTTDYGINGYHIAALKGSLLTELNDDAIIIDISNNIKPFNYKEAAFVTKNACNYFPYGTIHIIDVGAPPALFSAAIFNNHYFIGTDNGLFSLIFSSKPEKIYRLKEGISLAKAAISIALNKDISEIADETENFATAIKDFRHTVISENEIVGHVIYNDEYDNAIIDISKEDFYNFIGENHFEIIISPRISTDKISDRYCPFGKDTKETQLVALFGTHGFLEIALFRASAKQLLRLNADIESSIIVRKTV